jgi:hypothetical protein
MPKAYSSDLREWAAEAVASGLSRREADEVIGVATHCGQMDAAVARHRRLGGEATWRRHVAVSPTLPTHALERDARSPKNASRINGGRSQIVCSR